jgi:hypothetical protein
MSVNYKRKHQWTRSTEERKGSIYRSPTLIYTTSCREVQGERNRQRKRSGKKYQKHEDRGDISTGGVTLLPMMSKGEKEKDQKRNIRSMKIGGASPKGRYPFPLMSKGERNMRRERSGALVTGGV